MAAATLPGGTFTLAADLTVTRMEYGAMQLAVAGPHVFGPPADRDDAVAVLRAAGTLGLTHIHTADFYGPHRAHPVIKETPYPSPAQPPIATQRGAVLR